MRSKRPAITQNAKYIRRIIAVEVQPQIGNRTAPTIVTSKIFTKGRENVCSPAMPAAIAEKNTEQHRRTTIHNKSCNHLVMAGSEEMA